MEILDVYDKDGIKKGITVFRGEYIKPDDYILVSHIYIYDLNREFLIQKRSWKKRVNSGKWDITGGAVKAGETSSEAAIRETFEEVGLKIPKEKLYFAGRHVSVKHIVDIYSAEVDFKLSDCVLQKEEVAEVRLVPGDRLLEIFSRNDFQDETYNRIVENEIERIMNLPEVR